jgi:hypothetical protein
MRELSCEARAFATAWLVNSLSTPATLFFRAYTSETDVLRAGLYCAVSAESRAKSNFLEFQVILARADSRFSIHGFEKKSCLKD